MILQGFTQRAWRVSATLGLVAVLAGCVQTNPSVTVKTAPPDLSASRNIPAPPSSSTRQPIDLGSESTAQATVLPDETPTRVIRRGRSEARIGAEQHPRVLEEFGGEVEDPALRAYINRIGRDIVARTEQPNADWTFTVLDTPTVNAFALPGGYVYVTRGLIALADDEAELAAVIGHEIGHVTAKHGAERADAQREASLGVLGATILGAVIGGPAGAVAGRELGSVVAGGNVASYSRIQEFEADALGVRYIAATGYDPFAQADFLVSMQEYSNLQADLAGRARRGDEVSFLASHPSSVDREQRARRRAQATGVTDGARREESFMAAIDGMLFGLSVKNGVLAENTFLHPTYAFSVVIPRGWRGEVQEGRMVAEGPQGARLLVEVDEGAGDDPVRYMSDGYLTNFFNRFGLGARPVVQTVRRGNERAAQSRFRGLFNGSEGDVLLTTIARDGSIVRITGIVPAGRADLLRAVDRVTSSFDVLSRSEVADIQGERLRAYTVQPGDTQERIAQLMPAGPFQLERFRVLNSLQPNDRLQPGDQVKVVVQ
ncbi:MAG: M48 family metalloprotease [Pseudomonadota bacterium]